MPESLVLCNTSVVARAAIPVRLQPGTVAGALRMPAANQSHGEAWAAQKGAANLVAAPLLDESDSSHQASLNASTPGSRAFARLGRGNLQQTGRACAGAPSAVVSIAFLPARCPVGAKEDSSHCHSARRQPPLRMSEPGSGSDEMCDG